jgi:hypothetical protein
MGKSGFKTRIGTTVFPALLLVFGAGWAASPWQKPAARFVHYLRASGCDRQTGQPLTLRERVVYAYILARS